MLLRLLLLLTIVPLVELLLLVRLTQWTGSFALTVAIVIGTGALGAFLARAEGLRVYRRLQRELNRGELPGESLIDGVLILLAGALLLTPGLITDCLGFLLLTPITRPFFRNGVKRWARRKVQEGSLHASGFAHFGPIHHEPPPGAPPLEDEES